MTKELNANDIKLMLAMIASAEGLKTDNEKLANIIGGGVTANAIRQRVQKIKAQAKVVLEGGDAGIAVAGKATPTPKAKPTPKRQASAPADGEETPTKKRAVKGRTNVKAESEEAEVKKEVQTEEASSD